MKINPYIKRVMELPPHIVMLKVYRLLRRRASNFRLKIKDHTDSTYSSISSLRISTQLKGIDIKYLRTYSKQIRALSGLYLKHNFDLLGSGWVEVKYGMTCNGLEGFKYPEQVSDRVDLCKRINISNRKISRSIRGLLNEEYVPIDWHIDFKSGYRWSEKIWYRDIQYGHKPGVDIKVPWELARMQHLPQLAFAFALAKSGEFGFEEAEKYSAEFRNQILDFISANPPRFGVNWACTMDVAIRVANWLITFDLFKSFGACFDSDFIREFSRSVYDHGKHIINNLEWDPTLRGNHYLSNIVGLLFVAGYLSPNAETEYWLKFSIEQLIKEVGSQFNNDGSNFEGSTSYHRLSAEMVIYATALVLGLQSCRLNKKIFMDFPDWYYERLERMAEFTVHITKPNNSIVQIGDNDSGRFFKIHPTFEEWLFEEVKCKYENLANYENNCSEEVYLLENLLDHRHLVAAINSLFDRQDFKEFSQVIFIDEVLINSLTGSRKITTFRNSESNTIENAGLFLNEELYVKIKQIDNIALNEFYCEHGELTEALNVYTYPDFGLYIYRSKKLFMAVKCGPVGQGGNGGHDHLDQLHVELTIDGKDLIVDPGTYIYTALPEQRNLYRSSSAHFTNNYTCRALLEQGLFTLKGAKPGKVELVDNTRFLGVHEDSYRLIEILPQKIRILDYNKYNKENGNRITNAKNKPIFQVPFSDGYGRKYRGNISIQDLTN